MLYPASRNAERTKMPKNEIEIIYQDNNIIVINKPAGISVTKDRSGKPQLTDFLAKQIGKEMTANLRLVHRLDKDTSGVMILAMNRAAQRTIRGLFFQTELSKKHISPSSKARFSTRKAS